jgi:hypothetical protein
MLTNDLLGPPELERALGGTRRQPGILVELFAVVRKDATHDDARIKTMAPVGTKLAAPTLDRKAA